MASDRTGAREIDDGDAGMVARVGPVEVDVPRSIGYFGGAAAAVALGIIDPPLGLVIAAIPFVKMITRPGFAMPVRITGQLIDGMAKPLGGEGEGYIRLTATPRHTAGGRRRSAQGGLR